MISKFQVGLKSLLRQGLSEPEFYGDLVYKLKKIVGSNKFSVQFIKLISHYKILAIRLMYCNRLHAWWSIQSRLATLLSSLIARPWVGLQILWRFRLKALSIDEIGMGLMLWLLSGSLGFTCWICSVFDFMFC